MTSEPNHEDLFTTPVDGRSVLAVKLGLVTLETANAGGSLLDVPAHTPEWVNEAAADERIMLSKQPDSNLAHLWVETPAGGQLCCPGQWLLNVYGALYILDNSLFRHLFPIQPISAGDTTND